MNDKDYEREKSRIRKLINKWVDILGLGYWKLNFDYERETEFEGNASYNPGSNYSCPMTCSADPYYLCATITVYVLVTRYLKDEDLEEYFLHELMHIFVSPMRTKSKFNEEERVVTTLARAFLWATEKDAKPKRKPLIKTVTKA